MVSLWPWKGDDTSPASFEKTLSTLSAKTSETNAQLARLRQRSRRFKALWTLYSVFIYLLYTTIDVLVLGWRKWGYWEWGAVLGGPFIIYTVRAVASRVFEYRISRAQKYLDGLNQQRDETIEKLKVATKYNSTQQLLEKYGGESISGSPRGSSKGSPGGSQGKNKNGGGNVGEEKKKQQQQPGRTGIPPPPTANIRRPEMSPFASSSAALASVAAAGRQSPRSDEAYLQGKPLPLPPQQHLPYLDEPGFAPNAFPSSHSQMQTQSQSQPQSQYAAMSGGTPKWYDRLMDVLLGEDETLAKNRLVLICQRCRLVNGQAPPGVKSLSELGRWRCGSCGAWNGEESEAKKVIASVAQEIAEEVVAGESVVQAEEHSPNQLAQEEKEADANEDIQPIDEKLGTTQSDIQPRQTRSRAKNSKNSKN